MGQYAKRLHKKLQSKSSGLPTTAPARRPGEPLPGGVTDMETMIREGYDPIHAAYVYMQQLSAYFAEGVSQLPEMKAWARSVEKAEEEYMPAGPHGSSDTIPVQTQRRSPQAMVLHLERAVVPTWSKAVQVCHIVFDCRLLHMVFLRDNSFERTLRRGHIRTGHRQLLSVRQITVEERQLGAFARRIV